MKAKCSSRRAPPLNQFKDAFRQDSLHFCRVRSSNIRRERRRLEDHGIASKEVSHRRAMSEMNRKIERNNDGRWSPCPPSLIGPSATDWSARNRSASENVNRTLQSQHQVQGGPLEEASRPPKQSGAQDPPASPSGVPDTTRGLPSASRGSIVASRETLASIFRPPRARLPSMLQAFPPKDRRTACAPD
jgi:hypothetical protein